MFNALFRHLPTLETDRLLLRPLRLTDAEDVFAYAGDPEMTHYTTWTAHRSLADSRHFLQAKLRSYAHGEPSNWGVVLAASGRLIGTCGFVSWNPDHRRAEIGYALARRHWGQGLTTEAVRAVVDFSFRQTELYRLQALCLIPNLASARVMEKVGMRYEGILRGFADHQGQFSDLKIYAILRPDWESRRLSATGALPA